METLHRWSVVVEVEGADQPVDSENVHVQAPANLPSISTAHTPSRSVGMPTMTLLNAQMERQVSWLGNERSNTSSRALRKKATIDNQSVQPVSKNNLSNTDNSQAAPKTPPVAWSFQEEKNKTHVLFFCPSPLPFGGSTVLSLTRGPAGNRTTTGSLSATQECRDTNCKNKTHVRWKNDFASMQYTSEHPTNHVQWKKHRSHSSQRSKLQKIPSVS